MNRSNLSPSDCVLDGLGHGSTQQTHYRKASPTTPLQPSIGYEVAESGQPRVQVHPIRAGPPAASPEAACPSLDGTATKTAQQRQRKLSAAASPSKFRGTRRRSLRLQPRALTPLTPEKPPPDAAEARGTLTSLADEWAATDDDDTVRSKS